MASSAGERQGADGSFDGVVVDLDPAAIQEQGEPIPAREGVADGLCQLGLPAESFQLGAPPGFEGVDHGAALLLSGRPASLGLLAADVGLDGVLGLDPPQRLGRDRRRTPPVTLSITHSLILGAELDVGRSHAA